MSITITKHYSGCCVIGWLDENVEFKIERHMTDNCFYLMLANEESGVWELVATVLEMEPKYFHTDYTLSTTDVQQILTEYKVWLL